MKILITGGAGFIGSALANQLNQEGHHVRVIDDLSGGNPDHLHPNIHFTRGDVTDKPKLWGLLKRVDCVYHLAARGSVSESILYPRELISQPLWSVYHDDTIPNGTLERHEQDRIDGPSRKRRLSVARCNHGLGKRNAECP